MFWGWYTGVYSDRLKIVSAITKKIKCAYLWLKVIVDVLNHEPVFHLYE